MDNKWEAFSDNFEKCNEYVVGKEIQVSVKKRLLCLRNSGKVLELGCGNGTYTECFLNHADSIVTTDLSAKMVEFTQQRYQANPKVTVAIADCSALPYLENSFDTVFMANLFHIIPSRDQALKEVSRILKPDGRLIIVSFTLHQMNFWEQVKLCYRYKKTYGKPPESGIKLSPSVLNGFIQKTDFTALSCEMLGNKVKALYAEVLNR